jgi:hypothetical protein
MRRKICHSGARNHFLSAVIESLPNQREKYRDLLLDVAEMVLSNFGFSRDIYNNKLTGSLDWINELYHQRRKEALSEIESER